ncbi:MAG: NUDIX hydrolase [Desulfobulbus sp.]|jgi:ADP-ribose pyrophosphatase YjhB (NUDIX family)|uniref:NUDIX hydrolase n=1 Tax=Desulfobulbus sp. TaxID=895 RepID=UPI0028420A23|nr:NUDIX hydrolase [Desulfobulbus sp.]MDR2551374.1 NUDIX hydrolase [Desulfobulbus sp.]
MRCPACGIQVTPFKNPVPTVDIIIETEGGIVLIERKNPPFGWALPGGFVDYGESFEDAARREAAEETGLAVTLTLQFHTYSAPDRDARQHTASTVYVATASGHPVAADDAQRAEVFHEANLPPLVFDHQRILRDYFAFKQSGRRPFF